MINKLLSNLPVAFNTDPDRFLGLKLAHTSVLFRWEVVDYKLNGYDGNERLFSINLFGMTFSDLFGQLNTVPGLSFSSQTTDLQYPAVNIIPASGNQILEKLKESLQSIADFLYSLGGNDYSNPAYGLLVNASSGIANVNLSESDVGSIYAHRLMLMKLLDPMAAELSQAQLAVTAALDQMSIPTADGEWLDEWGNFCNTPRIPGESDASYWPRIIVEVLRPRANNIAIAMAIKEAFGQNVEVHDVIVWDHPVWKFDGTVLLDGSHTLSASSAVRYGLFDVVVGYDLENGGSQLEFSNAIKAFVNRFRAAGTQLRTLALSGVNLSDDVPASSDAALFTVHTAIYLDGRRLLDGSCLLTGSDAVTESLS